MYQSNNIRRASLIALVLTIGAWSLPAQSPPGDLDQLMSAVFNGPDARSVKVRGHKYHVKKAKVTVQGNTVTVEGQISHIWRFVRDDQVDYKIVKVDGRLKGDPEINIRYRGWGEAIKWAIKIYKWVKSSSDDGKDESDPEGSLRTLLQSSEDIWKQLGSSPKWEEVANALVNEIAMRAGRTGTDRVVMLRTKVEGARVTVFQHDTFRGRSAVVRHSMPDLHGLKMGDNISSIKVPRGYTVTLYEHKNFKGRSIVLTNTVKDFKKLKLGKKNWGDRVSSIKISVNRSR